MRLSGHHLDVLDVIRPEKGVAADAELKPGCVCRDGISSHRVGPVEAGIQELAVVGYGKRIRLAADKNVAHDAGSPRIDSRDAVTVGSDAAGHGGEDLAGMRLVEDPICEQA